MGLMGAKKIKPKILINVHTMIDYLTANFITGAKGEVIVNGGLQLITGVFGPPNSYKTVFSIELQLSAMNTIAMTHSRKLSPDNYVGGGDHDTEGNVEPTRIENFSRKYEHLDDLIDEDIGMYEVSDLASYTGDEYFNMLKTHTENVIKYGKYIEFTAFLDKDKKPIKDYIPYIGLLDSMSKLTSTTSIEGMTKTKVMDGGTNMYAVRDGKFKFMFINDFVRRGTRSNTRLMLTGHSGEKMNLDTSPMAKYNVDTTRLQYLNNNLYLKGVPKDVEALTSIIYYIQRSKSLIHKETKDVFYPLGDGLSVDPTDLNLINVLPLRNKHGLSGPVLDFIVSQKDGVLWDLTSFHFIRTYKDKKEYKDLMFGLDGSRMNYSSVFLPEVKLSRTTVRGKLDGSYKLRRAIEITSELLLIKLFHPIYLKLDLWCCPKTLYEDIKELGYDWDELLETTQREVPPDAYSKEVKPHINAIDLLKIRKGLYKPYWMKDKK